MTLKNDTARSRAAELLESAAAHVDPVDVNSVHPQRGLATAAELATQAWGMLQASIYPPDKKPLRIAVVSLRAMADVTRKSHSLQQSDANMLRDAARTLREVAGRVLDDPRVAKARMSLSVTGRRYMSNSELTRHPSVMVGEHAAFDDDSVDRVLALNRQRRRLPVDLRPGEPYVLAEMPIIVYPAGPVGRDTQSALDRAGVPGFVVRDAGGGARIPGLSAAPGTGSSIALERQLVVGFRRRDSTSPKLVSDAVADVSRRMGPHVCPVPDGRMLVSPGSHLDWLWLVPRSLANSRTFIVKSASFPWLSSHNAESHRLTVREEQELETELRSLDAQQEALLRKGQSLDDGYLLRQSQLRERLHRSDNVDSPSDDIHARMAKNKRDREELEARIKRELGGRMARLTELQEYLLEIGKPKEGEKPSVTTARKNTARSVAALKKEIEAERLRIMATMRRRPEA